MTVDLDSAGKCWFDAVVEMSLRRPQLGHTPPGGRSIEEPSASCELLTGKCAPFSRGVATRFNDNEYLLPMVKIPRVPVDESRMVDADVCEYPWLSP